MASVSLSRDLWDPYRVLDVYPNVPSFTEQFDTSQRATAVRCLESMSQMHPSEVTPSVLSLLAENTLCRDFHQRQAGAKITEWRAKINDYLDKHSERLAVFSAVTQLQYELDVTKQLQNGIAKEKDAFKQEVENLKRQLQGTNANFQTDMAASSKEIKGLKDSNARLVKQMDVAQQKLVERDRQVEQLQTQLIVANKELVDLSTDMRQQLAWREDKLSSLQPPNEKSFQPQNVKKGFFAVILRKISKTPRTGSAPYVQSAA